MLIMTIPELKILLHVIPIFPVALFIETAAIIFCLGLHSVKSIVHLCI